MVSQKDTTRSDRLRTGQFGVFCRPAGQHCLSPFSCEYEVLVGRDAECSDSENFLPGTTNWATILGSESEPIDK